MELKLNIIGCPIIREEDGLAMSSRNQLLSPEQRSAAPRIYRTLVEARNLQGSMTPAEISEFVRAQINSHPLMKLEYFEIVDDQKLMPVLNWKERVNKVGCIAVHLEEVRLIDNIFFD